MKQLFFLALCLLRFHEALASRTDFQTVQFAKVKRDGLIKPSLNDYPYLAVTLYFRNSHLLNDRSFIGRFNSLKYALAQAQVQYNGKSETVPLFFLQKENGSFGTTVFEDRTLIRKIPILRYGANQPTVSITLNTTIKDNAVAIIKTVADQIAPVIENPASIYGPAAAQQLFKFLTNVVQQLEGEKKVSSTVSFDAVDPADLGIKPLSYDVFVIKPGGVSLDIQDLKVAVDPVDNRLKVSSTS